MGANEGATRASLAVDDLYRSHVAEVYRYAYAMLGNRSDAEDVTQTTFVNALGALERGERPRKPSNWLITITHNIVRQRFRQQQARPAEVELDYDVALEEPEHDGPSVEDLVRALQGIPPTQRAALVMRELEGRTYKEIEALLDLTPAALETLLFRARRSLAEELENLVTCERAELAMSRGLDGRLSRKERRRLDSHLRECPSCARLHAGRTKHRRAFGALSLLPLPFSFTFFKGAPTASAAGGLSTIGTGGVTAVAGVSVATTCGTTCATGGLLAGGLAVKAVAVVAAATMAGSVGYEGVQHVRKESRATVPTAVAASSSAQTPVSASAPAFEPGTAEAPIAVARPQAAEAPQLDIPPVTPPLQKPAPPEPVDSQRATEAPHVAAPVPATVPEQAAAPPHLSAPPPTAAPPQAAEPPTIAPPATDTEPTTDADPTTTDGAVQDPGTDTASPVADTVPAEPPAVVPDTPVVTDTPAPTEPAPDAQADTAPVPTTDPAPQPDAPPVAEPAPAPDVQPAPPADPDPAPTTTPAP